MSKDEHTLKKWVLDRGSCRSSVTRFYNEYVKPTEVSRAQAIIQKCESFMVRLSELDNQIQSYKVQHELITDAQYAKEYEECEGYQDRLVQLLHVVKGHLLELQSGLAPVPENFPYQSKLSYQKLELPRFDGKPENYSRFILQFERIVAQMNIDNFGKYTLLEQQLQGEAKLLVSSVPVGNMDYAYAKKLLDKVYLSKEAQQFAILDRLSRLKMCDSEPFKWIGEVNVIKEQCTNLAIDTNVVLQYFFWHSLSESFRQQLISITNNSRPTLSQIVDNIFEANNRVKEFQSRNTNTVREIAPKSEAVAMATGVESLSKKVQKVGNKFCVLCNQDKHKIKDCQKFAAPQEKVSRLKQLNRCTKCTGNHVTDNCLARLFKCTKCGSYHLNYLCCKNSPKHTSKGKDKKSPTNAQKDENIDGLHVAAVSNVSTFTGNTVGDIILPTFTASLGGLVGSIDIRALYDPGSQASFVREDVANAINATTLNSDISLCIKGFNGDKSFKTSQVQFDLLIGKENVKVSAFCVPSFSISLNIDCLEEVVDICRSKGWDLADRYLSGSVISDIRLLLGSDNIHVLPTKSKILGGNNHVGPSCILESSLGILLQGSAEKMLINVKLLPKENN